MNLVNGDIQITVGIYVDDMMVTCKERKAIDRLLEYLVKCFKTVTIHEGVNHSFLGMFFDFSKNGRVRVSMESFVDDILHCCGVTATAVTPANANLFKVIEDGEQSQLLTTEQAKEFHSLVAKLLYLAKRTRPDILTAVSFLTTRVKAPTSHDQDKLMRVLKYLRGTKSLGIVLERTSVAPLAFIDASYGVHDDFKSHSGLVITLGKGPLFVASSKQKLNTKSSTEAEVVAISDKTGDVLWFNELLRQQEGYKGESTSAAVIYQDNKSAIRLAEYGKTASTNTRHMNIRYFFIKDKLESGELKIEHLNTNEMVADIMTKPLQGTPFKYLRHKLLNDPAARPPSMPTFVLQGCDGTDVKRPLPATRGPELRASRSSDELWRLIRSHIPFSHSLGPTPETFQNVTAASRSDNHNFG